MSMRSKMFSGFFSGLMMMGGLVFTGCQSGDEPNDGSQSDNGFQEPTEDARYYDIALNADQKNIRDKSNEFAMEVFNSISQTNKVVSPFSVFTTMAMLANGDEGEIRDEILTHFNLKKGDVDALNSYVQVMNQGFEEMYGKTRFCYANSIWTKAGLTPVPEFETVMKDCYKADFKTSTGDGEANKNAINSWISDKTKGLIPNLLQGPAQFEAALVNALYFKGGWQNKFDEEQTKEALFMNGDNTKSKVSFMNSEDWMSYGNSNEMKGVGMKLGKGNFRMAFLLPDESETLEAMVARLDGKTLSEFLGSMKDQALVTVSLPKFDCEYKSDIAPTLTDMGFGTTFSSKFNGIVSSTTPLEFSSFYHGARMKINEEGAEGAAASITMEAGASGDPLGVDRREVTFNRPFIYVLEEVSTGTILFVGEITKL